MDDDGYQKPDLILSFKVVFWLGVLLLAPAIAAHGLIYLFNSIYSSLGAQ